MDTTKRYVSKDHDLLERAYACYVRDPSLNSENILARCDVSWGKFSNHMTRNDLPDPRKVPTNAATPRGCRVQRRSGHHTSTNMTRYGETA